MFKPFFIDFEASSLSFDSYPIEVAWGSCLDDVENYLISPESITEWTDWSEESQKIHGIRKTELLEKGESPGFICQKIYDSLDNMHVYSDAPPFDTDWLKKLFDVANMTPPRFVIKDLDELLIAEIVCYNDDIDDIDEYIERLKKKSRDMVKIRHRANYDVQYLIELWTLCKSNS